MMLQSVKPPTLGSGARCSCPCSLRSVSKLRRRTQTVACSYSSAALRNVTPGLSKDHLVNQLLAVKEDSGKTFNEIAAEVGLTNLYTAQLFHNQAQLKDRTVAALQQAVPGLTDEMIAAMKQCPMRSYDPNVLQEPLVYRLYEAVTHYAESIKAIANEELGDGIMSAIDVFSSVSVVEGKGGEKRLVIQFNGKWLPHIEQRSEDNTAPQ